MDENESLQPTNVSVDPVRRPSPYELLIRQSRKMGRFATRTYDVTKEFLKADITALHPDAILFKHREQTPKHDNDDTVESGGKEKESTLKSEGSVSDIVKYSQQVLAAARTVPLPWNLFPDSVIVDRSKITIIKQNFFWSSETITVRAEDILNVTSTLGPIFGSIVISTRIMNSTDHFEIDSFWRKDAIYMKQIIQGYMIAIHSKIDTATMERQKLIDTLLKLGRDSKF